MPRKGSNLRKIEIVALGRQPHGCPKEVKPSWDRLVAGHEAVRGLFDTLHILREKAANDSDPRGRLSEEQLDQLRAGIVFTSAALDACLRGLLRDCLATLIAAGGAAEGAFTKYLFEGPLSGTLARSTKKAIAHADPRGQLIDMYVQSLAGSSLQSPTDLRKVRDALGLPDNDGSNDLTDHRLDALEDFFAARNEIAHELDLVEPAGRGSRRRRHRDMEKVGQQCNEALKVIETFLRTTAKTVKAKGAANPP